ncbi:MAG: LapA family protein [Betaproteobacteria bacterium]
MSLRTLFLLVVLGLLAIFTGLNWSAFTTPTTLSLVFTTVQAPLGLLMLVVTGLLAALFLLYVAYLQSTVILEARKTARELQAQRHLADEAEASRFTELRAFLESRISKLESDVAQSQSLTQVRLDGLTKDLRATIEQTGTVLTSYIGEVEDRLERKIGTGAGTPPP